VLGHVMTAIPIGGSRRDSGEHTGDSSAAGLAVDEDISVHDYDIPMH